MAIVVNVHEAKLIFPVAGAGARRSEVCVGQGGKAVCAVDAALASER